MGRRLDYLFESISDSFGEIDGFQIMLAGLGGSFLLAMLLSGICDSYNQSRNRKCLESPEGIVCMYNLPKGGLALDIDEQRTRWTIQDRDGNGLVDLSLHYKPNQSGAVIDRQFAKDSLPQRVFDEYKAKLRG